MRLPHPFKRWSRVRWMREIERNHDKGEFHVGRESPQLSWAEFWADVICQCEHDGKLEQLARSLDRKLDAASTFVMLRRAVQELHDHGTAPLNSLRVFENELRLRGTEGQSPYSLNSRLAALRPDFLAQLEDDLPDDPDAWT